MLYDFTRGILKKIKIKQTSESDRLTDRENKLVLTSGEKEVGRGRIGVRD